MNYVKLEYKQNGDGADCVEHRNIFVSKTSPTIVLWENDVVDMRIRLAHALEQGKPVVYRHPTDSRKIATVATMLTGKIFSRFKRLKSCIHKSKSL